VQTYVGVNVRVEEENHAFLQWTGGVVEESYSRDEFILVLPEVQMLLVLRILDVSAYKR
jgi:hypothetical protein